MASKELTLPCVSPANYKKSSDTKFWLNLFSQEAALRTLENI